MTPRKQTEPTTNDPALAFAPVPEPVDSGPHRYKVVGELRVCETNPGDTFVATLPPEQEKFLLDVGHIVRVGGPIDSQDKE